MVLLFYFRGMGVERPIFRFFDLAGEYLKGNEKNEWYHNTSHGFVISVIAQATGSSPPVKGIGHIIKRRNAGAIKRDGNKQPVCIYAVILHPVKHRHANE
jgi:hypothetical protein